MKKCGVLSMNCPNCGAEISGGSKCEYCGSQIPYEMRRELERSNMEGCPHCGSSNVSFQREEEGEVRDSSSRRILRHTVGVCGDCGYTWVTDPGSNKSRNNQEKTDKKESKSGKSSFSKKRLWIAAAILVMIIILSNMPGSDSSRNDDNGMDYPDYTDNSTSISEESRELDILSIDAIEQNDMEIDTAKTVEYTGSMTTEEQDDVYTFVPPREGVYRAELSDIHDNGAVELEIYDASGRRVDYAYCRNGDGLTLYDTESGSEYAIHAIQDTGFSPYKLRIGCQKEAIDISEYTLIEDSIEFTDQDNLYYFKPTIGGQYRFELSEIRDNKRVELSVFNHLGERLDYIYGRNNDGITINLEAGEAYSIHVVEESGFSPYNLKVGKQKEIVDISEVDGVNDSIEFTDQENVYLFKPQEERSYEFIFSELEDGSTVHVNIYNRLGEIIEDSYCSNGDSLSTSELNEGETYQIHVAYDEGISPYIMEFE